MLTPGLAALGSQALAREQPALLQGLVRPPCGCRWRPGWAPPKTADLGRRDRRRVASRPVCYQAQGVPSPTLQLGIIFLQPIQLAGVRHLHTAILRPPSVKCRVADPVLAVQIRRRRTTWCSFSTPIIRSCVNFGRFLVRLLLTDPNLKAGARSPRARWVHGSRTTLGGRAVLRLDQPPPSQGRRGNHRLGRGIPPRRFCYPVATTACTLMNQFDRL